MAYCAKCGKETKEGQIYCEECLSEMEDNTFGDLFDSFDEKHESDDTSYNSSEDDFTKIIEELQGPRETNHDKNEKKSEEDSSPSTVGDVFSDAVSAISSLEDELEDMVDLKGSNENPKPQKKGFFARLFRKKEKSNKTEDTSFVSSLEGDASEEKPNKKALKKAKKEKEKQEKAEKAKLKLAQKEKAKEEKAAAKQAKTEKKEPKKAKVKKENAKQETKKNEAKKKQKPEKALKKEKAKPEKVEEVLVEEEEGSFNPVALIVALGAFLVLTVVILFKVYTEPYNNSIETASRKFENKKYNQAFEEIYGLNIKKNDQKLYDKIMTVMYVNKQLNSYNNYMELNMYPEALDSLIKGLKRYDKYIDEASELGIADDLDYVRGQILKVLKKEFDLSEKKAMKLTKIEDQTKYSIQIYDIVIENTDYVNQ